MMYKFRFGDGSGPNGKRTTFNGFVVVAHSYPDREHCQVQISGPGGADRGSMILDKITARKLGAALLGWAMS